jgi:hypothetical protein
MKERERERERESWWVVFEIWTKKARERYSSGDEGMEIGILACICWRVEKMMTDFGQRDFRLFYLRGFNYLTKK